jgi:hypothetical protein
MAVTMPGGATEGDRIVPEECRAREGEGLGEGPGNGTANVRDLKKRQLGLSLHKYGGGSTAQAFAQ